MRQRTAAELWAEVRHLEHGETIDEFFERAASLAVDLLRCDAVAIVREQAIADVAVFTVPASAAYMPWVIGEWCFGTNALQPGDAVEAWNVRHGVPNALAAVGTRAGLLGFESIAIARLPTLAPRVADLMVLRRSAVDWDASELDRVLAIGQFIALALDHRDSVQVEVRRAEAMQDELDGRVLIEQAKGMVAARLSISVSAALGVIHTCARRRQCSVVGAAEYIVAGGAALEELTGAF